MDDLPKISISPTQQRALVDLSEREDQTLHRRSPNHLRIVEQILGPGSQDPRYLERKFNQLMDAAGMPLDFGDKHDLEFDSTDKMPAITDAEVRDIEEYGDRVLASRDFDLNDVGSNDDLFLERLKGRTLWHEEENHGG